MDNRKLLSPWQKIMRAAKAGRGLRLTAEEVVKLAHDDAIMTMAANEDAGCNVWED